MYSWHFNMSFVHTTLTGSARHFYTRGVTDSVEGMYVDPGETGAALQAGGVRGPGPPEGEKGGQLASDSGGG